MQWIISVPTQNSQQMLSKIKIVFFFVVISDASLKVEDQDTTQNR